MRQPPVLQSASWWLLMHVVIRPDQVEACDSVTVELLEEPPVSSRRLIQWGAFSLAQAPCTLNKAPSKTLSTLNTGTSTRQQGRHMYTRRSLLCLGIVTLTGALLAGVVAAEQPSAVESGVVRIDNFGKVNDNY